MGRAGGRKGGSGAGVHAGERRLGSDDRPIRVCAGAERTSSGPTQSHHRTRLGSRGRSPPSGAPPASKTEPLSLIPPTSPGSRRLAREGRASGLAGMRVPPSGNPTSTHELHLERFRATVGPPPPPPPTNRKAADVPPPPLRISGTYANDPMAARQMRLALPPQRPRTLGRGTRRFRRIKRLEAAPGLAVAQGGRDR